VNKAQKPTAYRMKFLNTKRTRDICRWISDSSMRWHRKPVVNKAEL